ncbi:hypothetical protein, partial [Methylobacterium sp. WL18]|uniref:hypothetical protein n=1 Tax=Methylobacterium sp. WL18 TaxID=2603897 RepID=UPI001AEE366D
AGVLRPVGAALDRGTVRFRRLGFRASCGRLSAFVRRRLRMAVRTEPLPAGARARIPVLRRGVGAAALIPGHHELLTLSPTAEAVGGSVPAPLRFFDGRKPFPVPMRPGR